MTKGSSITAAASAKAVSRSPNSHSVVNSPPSGSRPARIASIADCGHFTSFISAPTIGVPSGPSSRVRTKTFPSGYAFLPPGVKLSSGSVTKSLLSKSTLIRSIADSAISSDVAATAKIG